MRFWMFIFLFATFGQPILGAPKGGGESGASPLTVMLRQGSAEVKFLNVTLGTLESFMNRLEKDLSSPDLTRPSAPPFKPTQNFLVGIERCVRWLKEIETAFDVNAPNANVPMSSVVRLAEPIPQLILTASKYSDQNLPSAQLEAIQDVHFRITQTLAHLSFSLMDAVEFSRGQQLATNEIRSFYAVLSTSFIHRAPSYTQEKVGRLAEASSESRKEVILDLLVAMSQLRPSEVPGWAQMFGPSRSSSEFSTPKCSATVAE